MRFRKRSFEVEAIVFESSEEGLLKLIDFCGPSLGRVLRPSPDSPAEAEICEVSADGSMAVKSVAMEGDWVVKEPTGQFHSCHPEEFALNYEPADEMCPNCVTPWKCNGPHLPHLKPCRGAPSGSPESERYFRELGI